jgi:hypothetical protein
MSAVLLCDPCVARLLHFIFHTILGSILLHVSSFSSSPRRAKSCLQLRRLQTVKHDSEERRKEGLCHCFRDESGKTMQELGVAKH